MPECLPFPSFPLFPFSPFPFFLLSSEDSPLPNLKSEICNLQSEISHASEALLSTRMVSARRDVAGVAAQSPRLAGQVCRHPAGRSPRWSAGWPKARSCGSSSRTPPHEAAARRALDNVRGPAAWPPENVEFFRTRTDRGWTRDMGPMFVRRGGPQGELVVADFRFTAWAKYDDYARDDRVAVRVAKKLGLDAIRPTVNGQRVVLEGGAIDVNGQRHAAGHGPVSAG